MCMVEPGATPEVRRELQALRETLAQLGRRPDEWRLLLDLLLSLHRLSPGALRAQLGDRPSSEAEALRASLRRLAAEEEPMPASERRRRLQQVGGELLAALEG